jgi:hypothetical protein
VSALARATGHEVAQRLALDHDRQRCGIIIGPRAQREHAEVALLVFNALREPTQAEVTESQGHSP